MVAKTIYFVVVFLAVAALIILVRVMYLPLCDGVSDTQNCIWLADVQGNGVGRSFIDLMGIPFYLGK